MCSIDFPYTQPPDHAFGRHLDKDYDDDDAEDDAGDDDDDDDPHEVCDDHKPELDDKLTIWLVLPIVGSLVQKRLRLRQIPTLPWICLNAIIIIIVFIVTLDL